MKQRISKILGPILIIIAAMFAVRLYLNIYDPHSAITYFFTANRFDCMLIGAVGAFVYQKKVKGIMNVMDNKITQLVALSVGVLYALNLIHINDTVSHLIISIMTLVVIIGQVNVVNRIINLDVPLLRYLGKISFGIYVYHPLIIFIFSKLYKDILYDGVPKYLLVFFSVIATTILVSHLSYKYFESWFIKRKNKYAIIRSTAISSETISKEVPEIKIYEKEEAYST